MQAHKQHTGCRFVYDTAALKPGAQWRAEAIQALEGVTEHHDDPRHGRAMLSLVRNLVFAAQMAGCRLP